MAKALILVAVAAAISSSPAIDNGKTRQSANAEFLAKNYPPESLKRGEQGRVGFELTFETDGSLVGCAVSQSSGFPMLDEGTCEMLAKSAKIAPAKDASGRSVRTVRTGYIDWRLPAGVAVAARANVALARVTDPLVCRRTPVPGSIIKKVKRCMTKNEWAAQDRLVREETRRAMDSNTCSDHGC